jgi:hypothetical protein
MVGFPVHPCSSPRLGMGVCIFLDLFKDYLTLFVPLARRRPRTIASLHANNLTTLPPRRRGTPPTSLPWPAALVVIVTTSSRLPVCSRQAGLCRIVFLGSLSPASLPPPWAAPPPSLQASPLFPGCASPHRWPGGHVGSHNQEGAGGPRLRFYISI